MKTATLRILSVGVLSLAATCMQAQTYTSTDTPLGLPIGAPGVTLGTTSSTITVGDSLTIGDLNLNLDYNHSFQGDLNATIMSPNGTLVQLFESNLAHDLSAVDGGYLFDDEATDVFPGTIPAFPFGDPIPTGAYIPQNLLSAFDGEDTAGVWTLTINDIAGGDFGTLNFWQLLVVIAMSDATGSDILASMPIAEVQANSQFLGLLATQLRGDNTPRFNPPGRPPMRVGSGRSLIRIGANETGTSNVETSFGDPNRVVRGQGPSTQRSLWIAGYGASGAVDGGFDYNFGGTTFGVQQVVSPQTVVGIAGNVYVANGDGAASEADLNAIGFALYGNRRFAESAYVTAIAGYNHGSYTSVRQTATGSALGDIDSNSFLALVEVGENHCVSGWTMRPHLGLQYQLLDLDGYQESGAAPSNLRVDAEQIDSVRGIAGVDVSRSYRRRSGNMLTPRVRAAYLQEFADGDRVINGAFAGGGAAFPISGASLGNEFGDLGAGLNLTTLSGITLFADYDLQFTDAHHQHTGRGGVAVNW